MPVKNFLHTFLTLLNVPARIFRAPNLCETLFFAFVFDNRKIFAPKMNKNRRRKISKIQLKAFDGASFAQGGKLDSGFFRLRQIMPKKTQTNLRSKDFFASQTLKVIISCRFVIVVG